MQKLIWISLLGVLLFAVGCSTTPSSPYAPLRGNISGNVTLLDTSNEILDPTGVQATITGTTSTVNCDRFGKWEFPDMPAGIYNIEVTKPGFGTTRFIQVQFVGGGDEYVGTCQLVPLPTYVPTLDSVRFVTYQNQTSISVYSSAPTDSRTYEIAFADVNPLMSWQSQSLLVGYYGTNSTNTGGNSSFQNLGINSNHQLYSGEILYVRVATISAAGGEVFFYPNPLNSSQFPVAYGTLSNPLRVVVP